MLERELKHYKEEVNLKNLEQEKYKNLYDSESKMNNVLTKKTGILIIIALIEYIFVRGINKSNEKKWNTFSR